MGGISKSEDPHFVKRLMVSVFKDSALAKALGVRYLENGMVFEYGAATKIRKFAEVGLAHADEVGGGHVEEKVSTSVEKTLLEKLVVFFGFIEPDQETLDASKLDFTPEEEELFVQIRTEKTSEILKLLRHKSYGEFDPDVLEHEEV